MSSDFLDILIQFMRYLLVFASISFSKHATFISSLPDYHKLLLDSFCGWLCTG